MPTLIPVSEADRLLEPHATPFDIEIVPLGNAGGRILRRSIRADRAYPPLDRSRMDGVALAFAAWETGARAFPVAALARAGDVRQKLGEPFACVETMTGAPVPEGCDTIVPYEDVILENGLATIRDSVAVRRGQFIHLQGSDCARDQVLVEEGVRLDAARVAVAASMGLSTLAVSSLPRMGLTATGDELVGVESDPLPHQIRVSNIHGLQALLAPHARTSLHVCGDDPAALSELFARLLPECDFLLVTGGVSAGKFDAIPAVLESLGVRKVFHKVAQQPGKPLWFGIGPAGQPVFGLPGNPVSALICARRFVLPLLWAKSGWKSPPGVAVRLAEALELAPSRLTRFVPVRLRAAGAERLAAPCRINGSGDFAGLGNSEGFVELPPDRAVFPASEILSFYGWES